MAFREVRVFEVREVLRLWLAGESLRGIERLAGLDRKTIRRYIAAAGAAGVARGGGEDQLSDELIPQVVEAVRPHRIDGHGASWRLLGELHEQIERWVDADLAAVNNADLPGRRAPADRSTANPAPGGRRRAAADYINSTGWPGSQVNQEAASMSLPIKMSLKRGM